MEAMAFKLSAPLISGSEFFSTALKSWAIVPANASGSHVSNSDFDIAVTGKKINFRDLRELEEKIDEIAGLYSIDLIFMDLVEENFKNIILKTEKILYESKYLKLW